MQLLDVVTPNYEIYGVPRHVTYDSLLLVKPTVDKVNYVQGNPYLNTYNYGWRNHPNFSYKNNDTLFAHIPAPKTPPYFHNQKGALIAPIIVIKQLANKVDYMDTHNKMIDIQLFQVAKQ